MSVKMTQAGIMQIHHERSNFLKISWTEASGIHVNLSSTGTTAHANMDLFVRREDAADFIAAIRAMLIEVEGSMGLHDELAEEFDRRQAEMQFHDLTD